VILLNNDYEPYLAHCYIQTHLNYELKLKRLIVHASVSIGY